MSWDYCCRFVLGCVQSCYVATFTYRSEIVWFPSCNHISLYLFIHAIVIDKRTHRDDAQCSVHPRSLSTIKTKTQCECWYENVMPFACSSGWKWTNKHFPLADESKQAPFNVEKNCIPWIARFPETECVSILFCCWWQHSATDESKFLSMNINTTRSQHYLTTHAMILCDL
jgi:hypothetical protein